MKYEINGTTYDVIIEKKANKNTYIRIKDGDTIYVTTGKFVTKHYILSLLDAKKNEIEAMLDKSQKRKQREDGFYYFGNFYDIIIVPTMDGIDIKDSIIYVKNKEVLMRWYNKQMKYIFKQHFDTWYHTFEEEILYPTLKIRKMKTRWGVCNRSSDAITLNSNLMHYPIECLDYVIVHEFAHLVHFNHSKEFWAVVSKYCPDYKRIRKILKE